MKRTAKYALRLGAGLVMFLALTGPAPGNVGGCGSGDAIADPRQFCTDREFWECRRDEFAGRITPEQAQDCYDAVAPMCSGSNAWPAGCFPTPAQAQACINLLSRRDLSSLSTPDLLATYDDCNLCM